MSAELLIQNENTVYAPSVLEDIQWTTERISTPGKLTFKVIADSKLNITEGNAVRLKWNGANIFYGFIFSKQIDKDRVMTITAYDQLRYLKNKDTYVIENKSANEIIKLICDDFNMQAGELADTGYKIASSVEDNQTLFDIIENALDTTLTNTKQMYVMYDDFGKLTLKNIEDMKLNLLIDEETGENYDYTSSIDEDTYNKIKLVFDNENTGQRDVYIAQDTSNMNSWGVLQYYDTIDEGENGQVKADSLLSLYNQKTKKLTIKNTFGDTRVRAGSMVVVMLDLGDTKIQNYMLVEKCTHTFRLDEHMMELKLRGGAFTA